MCAYDKVVVAGHAIVSRLQAPEVPPPRGGGGQGVGRGEGGSSGAGASVHSAVAAQDSRDVLEAPGGDDAVVAVALEGVEEGQGARGGCRGVVGTGRVEEVVPELEDGLRGSWRERLWLATKSDCVDTHATCLSLASTPLPWSCPWHRMSFPGHRPP